MKAVSNMHRGRGILSVLVVSLWTAFGAAQSADSSPAGSGRTKAGRDRRDAQTTDATAQVESSSTQPVPRPPFAPGTIGQRHNELIRLKNRRLDEKEIALRAGLEFLIALGSADGAAAAQVVEAVGFQPLPLGEILPNPPLPLIPSETLKKCVSARTVLPIRDLPLDAVEIVGRDRLRAFAPAMAHWMLSSDWAVILDGESVSALFSEPVVLIVRIRAGRPTIMGGNLLHCL